MATASSRHWGGAARAEARGSCGRTVYGSSAPAFTLIEVVLVLSLLVLLASIAWPLMETQIRGSELPESANRLCSALYMARAESVTEHRRYRIRFEPGGQQLLIEHEAHPILYPGVFEAVSSAWAQEPVLLSNVQVHSVSLDRPVWTKPISSTSDTDEEQKELERQAGDEEERRLQEEFVRRTGLTDDIEIDENRPMIVFEPDGSTDWAVFVLARVDPEEELDEEEPQLWVVLDGRTGLAYVRDKLTEEQLSDSTLYVEREKLDLPDTVDTENLTFEVTEEPLSGGTGGGDSLTVDQGYGDQGVDTGGKTVELEQGYAGGEDEAAKLEQEKDGAGGNTGGDQKAAGDQGRVRQDRRQRGTGQQAAGSEGDKLDKKLNDSDLTEEEKANIRRWQGNDRK